MHVALDTQSPALTSIRYNWNNSVSRHDNVGVHFISIRHDLQKPSVLEAQLEYPIGFYRHIVDAIVQKITQRGAYALALVMARTKGEALVTLERTLQENSGTVGKPQNMGANSHRNAG
jgi:hypothetical protein